MNTDTSNTGRSIKLFGSNDEHGPIKEIIINKATNQSQNELVISDNSLTNKQEFNPDHVKEVNLMAVLFDSKNTSLGADGRRTPTMRETVMTLNTHQSANARQNSIRKSSTKDLLEAQVSQRLNLLGTPLLNNTQLTNIHALEKS